MKSSTVLKLTLMTGTVATLALCSERPQSFSSPTECVEAGNLEALCRSAYEQALTEHMQSAPTFASIDECRAKIDVDQCISVSKPESDGSLRNVIVPMMAGYMIRNSLKDDREDHGTTGGGHGYYSGGRYYRGDPIYRSSKEPGGYWSSSQLRTSTSPSQHPNVRTTTISRGGFGGRSSSGGG